MLKALVLIPGLCLIALGGEGLYRILTNTSPMSISCTEYVRTRPGAAWLRVSDCEVDYLGAGYRERNGRIEELLFPARPRGQPRTAPAALVAATRDPEALAIAQDTIGGGRQPDQEQFLVMMLRIITALRASRQIEGLTRTGLFARLTARRALSELSAPLVPGAVVIDLHSRPDLRWPTIELALGTALIGMALLWFRRSRRPDSKPADPTTQPAVAAPRQVRAPLRIRGLLLLNLQPSDGLEQIETAPPLGARTAVIAALQAAAPGLTFDARGRGTLATSNHLVMIDVGHIDPVHAAVAAAEGDSGIEILRTVIQRQGWRAYAPRAGVFIEPDALHLFALPDTTQPRST